MGTGLRGEHSYRRYYAKLYVRAIYGHHPDHERARMQVMKVNARVELHYCNGGGVSSVGYFDNPPQQENSSEFTLGTNAVSGSTRGYKANFAIKSIYAAYGPGDAGTGGGVGAMSTCA